MGNTKLTLASLTLACAVLLLFGLFPLHGADLLMHLTVGRWTWEHGGPPLIDHFSFTTPGEEFIAHSWLGGLVFYLIERAVGVIGLGLLCFTLISLALVCAVRTGRLMGAQWPAIILLAPVVLGLMWARLDIRPQLFTTLLLAFQLWLVVSVHLGRDWRWLFTLAPLYALAINLHGGWIQLPIMLLVCGLALTAMEIRRRWLANLYIIKVRGRRTQKQVTTAPVSELTIPSHLPLQHLALVLIACGLALFINPYGSRLLHFPFEMQASWIRAGGSEWQSPLLNANWQDGGGGVVVSMEPVFWVYAAVLSVVLYRTIRRWRTVDLVPLGVMAFWLAMSLWHLRAVSDAVLMTGPFIAAALPSAKFCTGAVWPQRIGVGLTLGLVGLSLPSTIAHGHGQRISVADALPCLATAFTRHGLSGRVFSNALDHWLLYAVPGVRVSGTWEYVGGPRLLADMKATSVEGLANYLDRYQVDVVVLSQRTESDGMIAIPVLLARGWVVIHLDRQTIILVPRRPDTADLIAREAYTWLPWPQKEPTTAADALELLEEAERAISLCPQAGFVWIYKADALRFLGFHDEADAAHRTAKSLGAMFVR